MERRHPYKGLIIEAHPYKLRDIPGWATEFYIEKHDGQGVTVRHLVIATRVNPQRKKSVGTSLARARLELPR